MQTPTGDIQLLCIAMHYEQGLKGPRAVPNNSPLTLILVLLRRRLIIILIAVGAHIIRTIHMTRICIHNIALHSVFELGVRDIKGYCVKPRIPYSWDIKQW